MLQDLQNSAHPTQPQSIIAKYQPLTNRARRPYLEILARGRSKNVETEGQ